MQTSDHISINAKFRAPYTVSNYVHLAITSNTPTPVYITKADRRHFVVQAPDKPLPRARYEELVNWWENGGAGAVLWHFQHDVDLDAFKPASEPPLTEAKRELVEANYSEAERLLTGDALATDWLLKCDLVTLEQLMTFIKNVNPRLTQPQVTNAFHRLGVKKRRVKILKKDLHLWPVRNFAKWKASTLTDMRVHVEKFNPKAMPAGRARKRLQLASQRRNRHGG